jgi:hypothetical protein
MVNWRYTWATTRCFLGIFTFSHPAYQLDQLPVDASRPNCQLKLPAKQAVVLAQNQL